jgi:hypothetical protein
VASEKTAAIHGDVRDATMSELLNVETVIQRWRRERVALLPPHEEQEVIAYLSRLGRPFSRDVISLYCSTGGMEDDGATDNEGLSLWSLKRLVTENLSRPRSLLLFMDFLINSHCYGLQYEDTETSSVHIDYFDGDSPKRVAGSLDEFFQLYLSEPLKLFL